MAPRTILLMRHAEKFPDLLNPELTAKGAARATALATYIPATFGRPDALFATMDSKHSWRPRLTMTPLAAALGLPIDLEFADQDYGALARRLLAPAHDGQLIVVCWHHGNIPSLAAALGARDGTYPDPWNPSVFDLILRFDYPPAGAPNVSAVREPF